MTGIVVSNKMEKALVVSVSSTKMHPKYHKGYKVKKRYTVSCEDSSNFVIGQTVDIESCRPVSKTIKFKVVENQK